MSGDDFAGGFTTERHRQGGRLVQPRAEVRVDEVDAAKAVPHQNMALSGGRHGHVIVLEHLDAAGARELHGLHGSRNGRHGSERSDVRIQASAGIHVGCRRSRAGRERGAVIAPAKLWRGR